MPVTRPTVPLMFRRALLLQCAWCGDRPGFRRGWFRRYDSCQHCGLSVQRGHDGFELGAATMNVMIMLATLVVAGGVSVVITYPDVAVTPLMVVLGVVAVALYVAGRPSWIPRWGRSVREATGIQPSGNGLVRFVAEHVGELRLLGYVIAIVALLLVPLGIGTILGTLVVLLAYQLLLTVIRAFRPAYIREAEALA